MRWRLHTSDCTWCGEKLLQPLRSTYISFNCKATVWKGHLSVTLAKVSATLFIHLCTAVIEHLHHIYIIFPRENTFWFHSEKFMTEIPFGPAPKQLKDFDLVDCWMLPYAADKYIDAAGRYICVQLKMFHHISLQIYPTAKIPIGSI